MPLRERESRPGGRSQAASVSTGIKNGTSLPLLALTELDALATHVDGAFVVVVKVTGGRHRRRCYLSAQAAENAAQRAVVRGEAATVYLAELKPLWRLVGGAR